MQGGMCQAEGAASMQPQGCAQLLSRTAPPGTRRLWEPELREPVQREGDNQGEGMGPDLRASLALSRTLLFTLSEWGEPLEGFKQRSDMTYVLKGPLWLLLRMECRVKRQKQETT